MLVGFVKESECSGFPWSRECGGTISRWHQLQLCCSWKTLSTYGQPLRWREDGCCAGSALCHTQVSLSIWTFCSLLYTGQSINMDLLLFAIHRSVYQYGALCYTQVGLSIWTFCSLLYTGQSINMDLLLFAIHRSVYQYGLLLLLLLWTFCSLLYTGQSINMDLLLFAIHRLVYQYGPSALCYTQVGLSIWTFCSLLYTGRSINMDLLLF